jgi:sulfate adenylyltransferase
MAPPDRVQELLRASQTWPTWTLTIEQESNVILLVSGSFAPLRGFMAKADALRSAAHGRLADGTFWPAPILLRVSEALVQRTPRGTDVALRDREGLLLAVLHVDDVWRTEQGEWMLGGDVDGIQLPVPSRIAGPTPSADAIHEQIANRSSQSVLAFMPSGFTLRDEFDSVMRVIVEHRGSLLLLPMATRRAPDDLDYFTRARAFRALRDHAPADVIGGVLPEPPVATAQDLAVRMIVARNFGATHFILPAPGPGAASADEIAATVGITVVTTSSPGTPELSRLLASGEPLPESVVFPEVGREIRRRYPPKSQQGITIFLTGLSGSGKSTIAQALASRLMELDERRVTLLDGDLVRHHLSSELGFSREHRDLNVRRIGFVAAEITKHGGIAICAPIAPYAQTRQDVRDAIEPFGGFCLVFVDTPLAICEERDRKGLYAKARAGLIPQFTGISDPYEAPVDADVIVQTTESTAEQAVGTIVAHLRAAGFLEMARIPNA